jgi:hypothetical protein
MKTKKIIKVSLVLVLGLFLISYNGIAQNTKLSRQEKKEVRKAEMNANYNILDSLFNARSFVLEADFLQDKLGDMMPVNSSLNFIRVNGSDGVLQTGSYSGQGYNGVGGVTASGTIGSWKIDRNPKKMTYTVYFNLQTQIGQYDVIMIVNSDNNATATITSTTPGRLSWVGHLKTVNNSRVFKGQNTI